MVTKVWKEIIDQVNTWENKCIKHINDIIKKCIIVLNVFVWIAVSIGCLGFKSFSEFFNILTLLYIIALYFGVYLLLTKRIGIEVIKKMKQFVWEEVLKFGKVNIENNFMIFRILYAYGSIELLTVFAFLLVMTFIIYILAQVLLVGKISLGDVFSILLVTVALVYVYWSMKRLEKKLYQKLSN